MKSTYHWKNWRNFKSSPNERRKHFLEMFIKTFRMCYYIAQLVKPCLNMSPICVVKCQKLQHAFAIFIAFIFHVSNTVEVTFWTRFDNKSQMDSVILFLHKKNYATENDSAKWLNMSQKHMACINSKRRMKRNLRVSKFDDWPQFLSVKFLVPRLCRNLDWLEKWASEIAN